MMSDCVALLVTLECDYQPGVLFPALVALCWLRTSPIFVGFAVLFMLSLPFSYPRQCPRAPRGSRSAPRPPPTHAPPALRPTNPGPDSDAGAPHVSLDRYDH